MSYSVFAGYYDLFTDDVDYDRRAGWIAQKLAENGLSGGLTLDLACGTGSLTWQLAGLGYDMIGTDQSPEMLMEAMAKAGEHPEVQPPLFLCQQMPQLDLYGTITAAVCTLDSLNHLSTLSEVEQTIQRVGLFMEKDGIFIFDVNTRYKQVEVLGDNSFVYENEEAMCVWRNRLSEDQSRVDIALDFFTPAGEEELFCRESEEFSEWYYSPEQLTAALEKAGFVLLGRYGGFSDQPPAADCQRAVYVARKAVLSQRV